MMRYALTEKLMENLVVENPERFVGEPGLRLVDRQVRVGPYIFDLLFLDRHGGKLIVELQRGTLDRDHTYRILDYYHEYQSSNPESFVDVMLIANRIPVERQRRLRDWGIKFKEIPESEFLSEAGRMEESIGTESVCEGPLSEASSPAMSDSVVKAETGAEVAKRRVAAAIRRVRAEFLSDPMFKAVRLRAEQDARNLLDEKRGRMTKRDIVQFVEYMNTEWYQGRVGPTRFGRHVTNINAKDMAACEDKFNERIGALWESDCDNASPILRTLLEKREIKGAGSLLPTFVMYLKEPNRYNVWVKRLDNNMKRACPEYETARGSDFDKYMTFNREVRSLIVEPFSLEPWEVDLVLWRMTDDYLGISKHNRR